MGYTPSGRLQSSLYKQELRGLIEHLITMGDPDNANAAVLAALGEVTAEFGIYAVGHDMTTQLFAQLADQVQTSFDSQNGDQ